ncbi:hypothetical protein [Taklimakanibacter lacteus]|uniref:hypothetical protein n=1 Tax=Taklimakanibacter lacteus TaxID=2268456 RepID=UPI000E674B23
MKHVLPTLALAAVASFAVPAMACEQHQSHAGLKTVEAAPPPVVVIEPAAQSNPASEIKAQEAMSQPVGAAYGNCNRQRKDQTVYLTQ